MFIVAVRHWGESNPSSFFGPFESHDDADQFKKKMTVKHSRRDAEIIEVFEP